MHRLTNDVNDLDKIDRVLEIIEVELGRVAENFNTLFPRRKQLGKLFIKSLNEIQPFFGKAHYEIRTRKEELKGLGLTGFQLDFKFSVLIMLKADLLRSWDKYNDQQREYEQLKDRGTEISKRLKKSLSNLVRTIRRNTKRLLEQSEVFLDSLNALSNVSPYLEPIGEIKATVENLCG